MTTSHEIFPLNLPCEQRLKRIDLPHLYVHHQWGDLADLSKILKILLIPFSIFFFNRGFDTRTRGDSLKFYKKRFTYCFSKHVANRAMEQLTIVGDSLTLLRID